MKAISRQWIHVVVILFVCVMSTRFALTSEVSPEIKVSRDNAGVHVSFTGELQSAEIISGPWTNVATTTNPFTVTMAYNPTSFFRAVGSTNPILNRTEMKIRIGANTFSATLEENPTTTAFKGMLPMTVNMRELNGNEKYYRLPDNLPTKPSNPGAIQSGDLMIYGADTLVLFYQSFTTSYSYTRLGRISDPSGLSAALGSGDVMITFELQEKPKANLL